MIVVTPHQIRRLKDIARRMGKRPGYADARIVLEMDDEDMAAIVLGVAVNVRGKPHQITVKVQATNLVPLALHQIAGLARIGIR